MRFSINNTDVVMRAEEVNQCSDLQYLTPERLGPLLVQSIIPQESSSGVVNVTFTCVAPGLAADVKIVATCYSHHTFLVMEKGIYMVLSCSPFVSCFFFYSILTVLFFCRLVSSQP